MKIPTTTRVLAFSVFIIVFSSCVNYKGLIIMEENEKTLENLRTPLELKEGELYPFKPYTIQPYDQLLIRLNAFDGSTEQYLNREFAHRNELTRNLNFDPPSLYFNTYTVDGDGALKLPIIERVTVKGLTVSELKTTLDTMYQPYLKFVATTVKMGNMHVTVLGEVKKPGLHYLYNEKNTILDVLSLAGNPTPFANLERVKLIRQTDKGAKTVYLNLSSPDFIYTEYFFVKPYDVFYFEPAKTAKALDSSSDSIGIVLSTISIIVLLINIFVKR